MSFYELQSPTDWAGPPPKWSSSVVDDIEACPRRWQLLRSRWGDYERFPVRPSPAAIEGQIIHDAIDRLTRSCGQRGNPAFGSEEFSAALADSDFFPGFTRSVADWQQRLISHPRPGPAFRLRTSPEDLANRAVRMFREHYQSRGHGSSWRVAEASRHATDLIALIRQRHAISEVRLQHPDLPFVGVLDRVQQASSGTEIIDFKTGQPSPRHREQLLRYALLWWRTTNQPPARVSAQYIDRQESWDVTPDALIEVEDQLGIKLEQLKETLSTFPAVALPRESCRHCAVRARCADGWRAGLESSYDDSLGDAELTVTTAVSDFGFLARNHLGREIAVVYESPVARLLPEYIGGRLLRIINGVWKERGTQLELKSWSEVFLGVSRVSSNF